MSGNTAPLTINIEPEPTLTLSPNPTTLSSSSLSPLTVGISNFASSTSSQFIPSTSSSIAFSTPSFLPSTTLPATTAFSTSLTTNSANPTILPFATASNSVLDAGSLGLISTTIIAVLLGVIIWVFTGRTRREVTKQTSTNAVLSKLPDDGLEGVGSGEWMSDSDFFIRSIRVMGSIILLNGVLGLLVGLPIYITTKEVGITRRAMGIPLSNLDRLSFLRLLQHSSSRISIITVLILSSAVGVAILLALELRKVKKYRTCWLASDSGGNGWEVGYLSLSDTLWQGRDVAEPFTAKRMKDLLFICGLGARQRSRGGELQEICTEQVFAVKNMKVMERMLEQREQLIEKFEKATAEFLGCFRLVEDQEESMVGKIAKRRKASLPVIRIVPFAPSSHYRLTTRIGTPSPTFEVYPPPTTEPVFSTFTETGLFRSRNCAGRSWKLGDAVEDLEMSEIQGQNSPIRSIYSINSEPPSATLLLPNSSSPFEDHSPDFDESLEELFRESRNINTSEEIRNRRSRWPVHFGTESAEGIEREGKGEVVEEVEFFPVIVPIKGIEPSAISELAKKRNLMLTSLLKMDLEIETTQKRLKEELENGIGIEGFILVGIRVCEIPGVREITARTVEEVRWDNLEKRGRFSIFGKLVGLVLGVMAMMIPIAILALSTASGGFLASNSNLFASGLVMTLVPVLVSTVLIVSAWRAIIHLKSHSSCDIQAHLYRMNLTIALSIISLVALFVASVVILLRINSSVNSSSALLVISPFVISLVIFIGIVCVTWILGDFRSIRLYRRAQAPNPPSSTNDGIRYELMILFSTLVASFSTLIPLVNLGSLAALLILWSTRNRLHTPSLYLGSSGLYHIRFLSFLILSTAFQPLLLSLLLFSTSSSRSTEASLSIVFSIIIIAYSVYSTQKSVKPISIFTKKSLNVFRATVNRSSSSNSSSRQTSNASRSTRRSIASALEILESFSESVEQPRLPLAAPTISHLPKFSFDHSGESQKKEYMNPLLSGKRRAILLPKGRIGEDTAKSLRLLGLEVMVEK